jgi:hypothetical protein
MSVLQASDKYGFKCRINADGKSEGERQENNLNIDIIRKNSNPNKIPRVRKVIIITIYDFLLNIEKNKLREPKKMTLVNVIQKLEIK